MANKICTADCVAAINKFIDGTHDWKRTGKRKTNVGDARVFDAPTFPKSILVIATDDEIIGIIKCKERVVSSNKNLSIVI